MLHLTTDAFEEMASWAREHLPEEACGLIAGRRQGDEAWAERVFCLENEDHSSEHFTISAASQLRCIREARTAGLEILGNWHSHPETPARPSKEDLRLANDPKALYVVLSLEEPRWPSIVAYTQDEKRKVSRMMVAYDA
ncbi:MAG: M67 family metallopeptidase [Olsenella sp.]|jgi:proteasome lid subunit RPN8/RPN11|nr:M67 family metallopeptidase [Olsenella sp.]MCI1646605.1 M67 family metallopeptidase [Olsenella sp.]MCI1793494.1 M67 family metallopeptidase [Olsenella sp.]MCI1879690.1 M67 family metallopeptidase [Olsenella sp.]